MKNPILLCINLLIGRQCVGFTVTLPTNDTTLLQNFKQSSPGSNDTLTRHIGNMSNISSGSDVSDQAHSVKFNEETSGSDIISQRKDIKWSYATSQSGAQTQRGNVSNTNSGNITSQKTWTGNFSNTTTGYDKTEITHPDNGKLIYIPSGYDKIDTELSNLSFRLHRGTDSIDSHISTLLSNTTSSIIERELVLTTETSELSDITYDNNNNSNADLMEDELINYQANNENKLEGEVGDDHGEGNLTKGSDDEKGEEQEYGDRDEGDIESYGHEKDDYRHTDIIWYIIWSIIGLVGIVGNVCLCMVFILRKEMRTFPNLMIINLAISDIFCILINIPLTIVDLASSSWQFGKFLCQLYYWTQFLTTGSSAYSVAVISLQRFFALMIFKPNASHCPMFEKYKPFLVLTFVWTLAAALPITYSVNLYVENSQCYLDDDDGTIQKTIDMVYLIVYCVIPLTIISFSTAAISIRLKKSVRNMPGEVIVQNNARRDRVVNANVLLALTIVFALSYVPYFSYQVYLSWYEIDAERNMGYAFYAIFFAYSCFSPIALFIMSRKYRRILVSDIIYRKNIENSTTTIEETRL